MILCAQLTRCLLLPLTAACPPLPLCVLPSFAHPQPIEPPPCRPQDRAARIIEGSAKLRSRLGGDVRVLPPVSQSSMSSSVNGRMTKTVTLLMPVVGAGGQTAQVGGSCGWLPQWRVRALVSRTLGLDSKQLVRLCVAPCSPSPTSPLFMSTVQAQVQFAEGEGASGGLTVAVRLPNGEVVQLDGGSSPSAQTIDVEWRSVDDK